MTWTRQQIELRFALASMAILSLALAWSAALLDTRAGHCLQGVSPGGLHCPLCWAAALLAALAVVPYPRRQPARP